MELIAGIYIIGTLPFVILGVYTTGHFIEAVKAYHEEKASQK